MKKKLISAMIYIYIAVVVGVVASAETITSLGVTFPVGKLLKFDSYTETYPEDEYNIELAGGEFKNWRQNGVQGTIKVRHIFDSGFTLGADFDIGAATMKVNGIKDEDKFAVMNIDLALGYAIVDNERFTLILSAIAGYHHQKQTYSYYYPYEYSGPTLTDVVVRYMAFEIGGELFMNFRIGDCVGLFASCKFIGDIGKIKIDETDKYGDYTYEYHKTTAFVVKPSVGVSFTF